MAGGAAGFELGGDGPVGLKVRRIVVEFEEFGLLTVDALVVVRFEHNSLLASGGMPPAIRRVDWSTRAVVNHHANKGLIEALADCVVGDRRPVVEGRAVAADMDYDLGDQVDVVAQKQQNERVGSLLCQRRDTEVITVCRLPLSYRLPLSLQLAELLFHGARFRSVRGRISLTGSGRFPHWQR